MEFITALWLPILLSAAAVWIVSAVIWMALPHHSKDHDRLPDQAGFIAAIKSMNIPPGVYGYPHFGSRAECNSPEAKKAWAEGPVGLLYNWKPGASMGKNMVLTFLVYIVISVFIAYITWNAFRREGAVALGAPTFADVMQIAGAAGVVAYAFAFIPNGIWFQVKPRAILMNVIDGVVYGVATGAIFAWRWPAA